MSYNQSVEELMTVSDLKSHFKCGNSTIEYLLKLPTFPAFKIPGKNRWYVDPSDLKKWETQQQRRKQV